MALNLAAAGLGHVEHGVVNQEIPEHRLLKDQQMRGIISA
jgi:hypothetical protein